MGSKHQQETMQPLIKKSKVKMRQRKLQRLHQQVMKTLLKAVVKVWMMLAIKMK